MLAAVCPEGQRKILNQAQTAEKQKRMAICIGVVVSLSYLPRVKTPLRLFVRLFLVCRAPRFVRALRKLREWRFTRKPRLYGVFHFTWTRLFLGSRQLCANPL